ncbi:MAG: hypothetical protein P4L36_02255 [Holophaga sp.]|nr:hypothetical protein [Holophaga sp.]
MRTFNRCYPRPTACRVAAHILLGLGLALLLATVFGVVLKCLWNYTMPGLFHLPAIGFCKAVALLIMARLLFGRFNHHHRPSWMHRRDHRRCFPSQAGERWWHGRGEPGPGAPGTD